VRRAGVEPAQRMRVGYSHLGSPVPSRHVLSVPWMGFEPMLSTVRAWRPLRAGPPGHVRQWPRGELNPQHPSFSKRVVCRLPTGPQSSAALSKNGRSECPAGVEPACPVWKTDAWAARPRALLLQRKERESNPQGSSLVRVRAGCRRQSACPSVCQSGWLDLNQRGPASDAGG
jgi:hypothetical protein